MRAAFIADCHIHNHKAHGGETTAGLNERCRETLAVLKEAVTTAINEYEVDVVVSLGDLFDTTKPLPQVMHATQDALCFLTSASDYGVAVLLGNHERVSGLPLDNSIALLGAHPNTRVFEQPGVWILPEGYIAMVPFQAGVASEWLEDAVKEALGHHPHGKCLALCLHLGLRDGSEGPWAAAAKDAINIDHLAVICHKHRIPAVFAGNWHSYKTWVRTFPDGFTVTMTQVGALVPTGWDNPGIEPYGGVVLLGCESSGFQVPGPRFIQVTSQANLAQVRADHAGQFTKLYVRAKVPPQHLSAARSEMDAAVGNDKDISWEVVVDQKAASKNVRKAAIAAKSKSTLQEAVAAYFDKLKLDVDEQSVHARVRRYLGL